ncbi:FecR domain-containing protein [Mucilaginibacter sp. RS28]|uniref:FecR domain-containing protein n=1 Tax=Mucilaginibacter straminoryzae TaxID=2932774 RepID=A0A9X1X4Q8_9SPHI|nr:FecR domain-containing protein [Mucilaginibacter straminoryzae]MCJ8209578.1 FecR domain-containing protein [Mucilaginibacter straminoryzae]
MEEQRLKELIKKYLSGTATKAEKEDLLKWYQVKDGEELVLPYESEQEEKEAKERIIFGIRQQLFKQENKGRYRKIYYRITAAAAIILVILVGAFFHKAKNQTADQQLNAYNTVETHNGERKIVKLTDGSVIWLSAGSKLIYPAAFTGLAKREVKFEGEAFFDIAKDHKHPFIVHIGKTSTKVLGTTFNITALKSKPMMTVSLLTGKVAFSDGKSAAQLMPNHMVSYFKNSGITKVEKIDNPKAVLARREGFYEYNNIPVAEVLEDFNRVYNADVKAEGRVSKCLFYGRLKPTESKETFLKKLATVVNARLTQHNGTFIIKGGGCN